MHGFMVNSIDGLDGECSVASYTMQINCRLGMLCLLILSFVPSASSLVHFEKMFLLKPD